MSNARVNRISGLVSGGGPGRTISWNPPRSDPPDLILARKALDRGQFTETERHLRRGSRRPPNPPRSGP